jgi:L-asparaginase II
VTRFEGRIAPIAVARRSGLEESVHFGAAVAVGADGAVVAHVGDPTLVVYPRSCLKPLQADAMLGAGLELPPDLLAIACASHDGTDEHLDAVRAILALAGLSERHLQNTPGRPLADPHTRAAPTSLHQNCSGKHAAMLATCVVNGWPIDRYLEPDHPLQVEIVAGIERLGCRVHHVGVDGCGAPTHALALDELARAFASLASTSIGDAMSAHPVLVGGVDSEDTIWMQALPGGIAKLGAAAMMAAAFPDGRAFAFKIADASNPARRAVVAAAYRALGLDVDALAPDAVRESAVPVLGHGRAVGELGPVVWSPWSS